MTESAQLLAWKFQDDCRREGLARDACRVIVCWFCDAAYSVNDVDRGICPVCGCHREIEYARSNKR